MCRSEDASTRHFPLHGTRVESGRKVVRMDMEEECGENTRETGQQGPQCAKDNLKRPNEQREACQGAVHR